MNETLKFSNRVEFRAWLVEHCATSSGVWLLFGKAGGPKTITANGAVQSNPSSDCP